VKRFRALTTAVWLSCVACSTSPGPHIDQLDYRGPNIGYRGVFCVDCFPGRAAPDYRLPFAIAAVVPTSPLLASCHTGPPTNQQAVDCDTPEMPVSEVCEHFLSPPKMSKGRAFGRNVRSSTEIEDLREHVSGIFRGVNHCLRAARAAGACWSGGTEARFDITESGEVADLAMHFPEEAPSSLVQCIGDAFQQERFSPSTSPVRAKAWTWLYYHLGTSDMPEAEW